MPRSPDDFEAQHDLETLASAKEIQSDQRRMDRAKGFAERRAAELKSMAEGMPGRPRRVDNATRRGGGFDRKRA